MADAGFVHISLIWVAYTVTVAFCLLAAIITFTWQTPRDRSAVVSLVATVSLTALLATVLLLPVDIALVSATVDTALGVKKSWATPDRVRDILSALNVAYYTLYSVDALLCLIVIPFAYFWYEEYDEIEVEEQGRTWKSRFWAAAKYTLLFVALVVVFFLLGFFVPAAGDDSRAHWDLDYFKRLVSQNHGEKALTFALGLLITLGTLLYVVYTGAGLALMPISLIRSAPAISAPQLSATTASQLEQNQERQRQLEMRNAGREQGMSRKDRRELEALVREEQTLVRRARLAADAQGQGRSHVYRAWLKICALFRPVKMLGGILLLLLALLIWVSIFVTGIDKAANSTCKQRCGYILGHVHVFQPLNWIFVKAAKAFPVDHILMVLLVLFLFSSSISGIATVGVRFLWIRVFQIRRGHTAPQALLTATVMMALAILAINYAIAMLIVPQYFIYGTQTFCTKDAESPAARPACEGHSDLIRPCSELLPHKHAADVCTSSVMSTFFNRINITWPFFGVFDFWAQFVFLAVFLLVFGTSLFRAPRINMAEMDEDAEADEEESLLASSRCFGAPWQDLRGKASGRNETGSGQV